MSAQGLLRDIVIILTVAAAGPPALFSPPL